MPVYRTAPDLPAFHVEARVRGPLGEVTMAGIVEALDEQGAVERFSARLEGFDVVEVRAKRA